MAGGQSYEVSIFVRNHWEIQSRFRGSQKDMAIENARSTERARPGTPVKVVQESYNTNTGRSVEIVVYKTPKSVIDAHQKAKMARMKNRHGGGNNDYLDLLPDPFDKPAKPKGSMTLMGMVFMILLASSGMSAVATLLFSLLLPRLSTFMGIGNAIGKEGLFGIFMIFFILTAGVMIGVYRSRLVLAKDPDSDKAKKAYKDALYKKEDKKTADDAKAKEDEKSKDQGENEKEGKTDDKPKADEEGEVFPLEDDEKGEETEDSLIDKAIEAHEEAELEEISFDDDEDTAEEAGDSEAYKITMMNFLTAALKSIAAKGNLDNFSRFGINLFIAGAVEMIAAKGSLSQTASQEILEAAVKVLGTKQVQAEKFSRSFESYLLNSRYLEMVDSGRQSMSTFMDGDLNGAEGLAPALEEWINPPEAEQAGKGPLAVMFTDIVGSTDMTVALGDHAAQHMVRTHNRIVRTALTNYYGREIKHTGDGIMASFSDVINAVHAAIEIQKRTIGNNHASPDQAFNLRIGIEAGEPIAEENDLFGVTVQMAARLCAACEVDQILIAQEVYKATEGTDIVVQPMPPRKMKGFAEAVPLWAVLWDTHTSAGAPGITNTPATPEQPAAPSNAAAKLPGLGSETNDEGENQ